MASSIELNTSLAAASDAQVSAKEALRLDVMGYLEGTNPKTTCFKEETLRTFTRLENPAELAPQLFSLLTFTELRNLFGCDGFTESHRLLFPREEELIALLERCDAIGARGECMKLFLHRINPEKAVNLICHFEWKESDLVAFVEIFQSKFNDYEYRPDEAVLILDKIQTSAVRLECMKRILTHPHFSTPQRAIYYFNGYPWEDCDILDFIRFIKSQTGSQLRWHFGKLDITSFDFILVQLSSSSAKLAAILELIPLPPSESELNEVIKMVHFLKCEERERLALFDYLFSQNHYLTTYYISNNLDRFDIQNETEKKEIAMRFIQSGNSLTLLHLFGKFNFQDEGNRAEIVELLAAKSPYTVLTEFSRFNIQEDSNKSKILTAILRCPHAGDLTVYDEDDHWQETFTINFSEMRFSSKANEEMAFREAIFQNPHHAPEFIKYTELAIDNVAAIKACVEYLAHTHFNESKIVEICLPLLKQIKGEENQLKSLLWLGNTLVQIHALIESGQCERASLLNNDFPKTLSALMMLPNPQIRDQLTIAFKELLTRKIAFVRSKEMERKVFNSHFYQLVKKILPPTVNVRRIRSTGLLPEFPTLSAEEQRVIKATFQSYLAHQELHCLENYESRLLNPILKVIKGSPQGIKQKFKRELCGLIRNPFAFTKWLESIPLSPLLKEEIGAIFSSYRDAPPKYNFSFVSFYLDLLYSSGLKSETINAFAEAVRPTFAQNYYPLLEALNQLFHSSISAEEKESILVKLRILFLPSESIQKTRKELLSLVTIFLLTPIGVSLHLDNYPSISSCAELLIQKELGMDTDVQFLERFQESFLSGEMGGLFPMYIAKLKTLDNPKIMIALGRAVHSVISGKYQKERIKNSPQLNHLKTLRPDTYQQWKNLEYSHPFTLSDEHPSSFPFDPFTWLQTKLLKEQKMEISHFSRLQLVLGEKESSASSSSESPIESLLIQLAQSTETSEQIALLSSLAQYPMSSSFSTDIQEVLKSLQTQKSTFTVKTSTHHFQIFLCGNVFASCQRLDGNPEHTQCVLGFLDGKYIPLVIQNAEDDTISRSFLVLSFEEDSPVLLLERFYTKKIHPQMINEIENAALAIAKKLHLPLVIKTCAEHYQGGFKYSEGAPFPGTLKSLANGWGPEYSDAGGGIKESDYIISSDRRGELKYLYAPK